MSSAFLLFHLTRRFLIVSDDIAFQHDDKVKKDFIFDGIKDQTGVSIKGTFVMMYLEHDTKTQILDVHL